MSETPLPPCGLYRSATAVGSLKAPGLVYFHNHSDAGGPVILVPAHNRNNRWHFAPTPVVAPGAVIEGLVALKREGLYVLRKHFHPDARRVVPERALVQLGYNRAADPIVFFPRNIEGHNGIGFPAEGMKIPKAVYQLLDPVDLRGPVVVHQLH